MQTKKTNLKIDIITGDIVRGCSIVEGTAGTQARELGLQDMARTEVGGRR
jgi:hypothetical protein